MFRAYAPFHDEVGQYYSLNERFYVKFAPFYDFVVSPFKRLRRDVVDITGAAPHSKVLDVATGTGEQASAFAANGCDVIGLDISDAMLERARKKARAGNPHFVRGDATRLPYKDGEFDATCVSFALHEMPPTIREQTLREMVRATKAGGKVVVADYGLPTSALGAAVIFRVVKLYESDPYAEFVRTDLRRQLEQLGVRIEQERAEVLGAVRIVLGTKVAGA
jgi:demethylmenaquinone methyltransferase/2-methoxy-6-polyprenyl-1,4-benzoquinol methylase